MSIFVFMISFISCYLYLKKFENKQLTANGIMCVLVIYHVFFNATGNLCTAVGAKKKKKVMYVTTKNAGNQGRSLFLVSVTNSQHQLLSFLCCDTYWL